MDTTSLLGPSCTAIHLIEAQEYHLKSLIKMQAWEWFLIYWRKRINTSKSATRFSIWNNTKLHQPDKYFSPNSKSWTASHWKILFSRSTQNAKFKYSKICTYQIARRTYKSTACQRWMKRGSPRTTLRIRFRRHFRKWVLIVGTWKMVLLRSPKGITIDQCREQKAKEAT